MSFVCPKLTGRLGNNAIQIMTCIATALKNNCEYKIPSFVKSKYTKTNPFDQFPLLTPEDEAKIEYEHHDDGWHYTPIPYKPNMRLHGYYQNLNYYDDYRKEIIEAFNLPKEKKEGCAIHVRLGDFRRYPTKWPIMTREYFYEAGNIMKANGINDFYVFSDEPKEAIQYISDKPGNLFFCNSDPLSDWIAMSQFSHHIIPNSTFSYSSAYLKRGEGITIAPKPESWYGQDNKHIFNAEFLPKNWIKI